MQGDGPVGAAVATREGLSSAEAARRLERFGPNEVAAAAGIPVWRRVLAQLRDPLVVVLLGAAVLTIVTGDLTDAAVITLVIVVNTTVGVAQEVKADSAVAALSRLSAPTARVVRDAHEVSLPAAEVVPGDVVHLGEGDIVPADAELLEGPGLLVDEAALTGESVPVDKAAVLAGADSLLSAGTVVVRGRGVAVVTATGASSALGRIASLLDTATGLTPLQRRLVGLGRVLATVALVLCVVVMVLGLVRGQPLELMLVTAVSLAVAAVPESLPAVVTLSLALGARRMAERNAIVRRLPAVETLGSVTLIATDKTGTLTEGHMVAEELWTPTGTARVSGSGYEPRGEVTVEGRPVADVAEAPRIGELLAAGVLCNDARLVPPGGTADGEVTEWTALGDPTEAALLVAGEKLGLRRSDLERELPRLDELPFDSVRKRMATVHQAPGGYVVYAKGAPDVLLSPGVLRDPPAVLDAAEQASQALALAGYRVLAVATRRLPRLPADLAEAEQGLSLLGLVGILDPPRANAAHTIEACHRAGITSLLITGDHPATAAAVARRLGILEADGPPGPELATGSDLAAGAVDDVSAVRVFARTTPEQKLDIVDAWRSSGAVVAMTGDGVNDGPALKRADIGVAMGRRGTEVARQAADLVLADDDLATVVAAVEEGRRVYDNVRRFLAYGLSGGAAEILVMLVGPFLGLTVPLLPAQILWVNLLTHGLPGVALGAEPAERDTMARRPRPPDESVLGAGLWQRIARLSVVITLICLGLGVWGYATGREWQSMLFVALGATQLGIALGSRARPGRRDNPLLLLAVAAALALQVAGVYLPLLRELLGTSPLPLGDLALALAAVPLGYLAIRAERAVEGLRARRARPAGAQP